MTACTKHARSGITFKWLTREMADLKDHQELAPQSDNFDYTSILWLVLLVLVVFHKFPTYCTNNPSPKILYLTQKERPYLIHSVLLNCNKSLVIMPEVNLFEQSSHIWFSTMNYHPYPLHGTLFSIYTFNQNVRGGSHRRLTSSRGFSPWSVIVHQTKTVAPVAL